MTGHWAALTSLGIFTAAYVLVVFEEATHMRKSKPVMLAAGLIWALIGIAFAWEGRSGEAHEAALHMIEEYGELFLFLLVAITYVNTLEERRAFDVLRARLVAAGLSYRGLFWLLGGLAFCLSPVLDNLTTALVMGAAALALGRGNPGFVALSCISIVVAANAGGAFSPFGDITTLMVWQQGKLHFTEFFDLFFPALANWLVPAALMARAVPKGRPAALTEKVQGKPGLRGVIVLFALTIVTAVSFKNFLALPPAMGMMLGLGYLQMWSYWLQRRGQRRGNADMVLDSFKEIQRVEWDTLLFFFGILFAVGGLAVWGYLAAASNFLYGGWGPSLANITIGALSAVIDNIPLMFAVLLMDPVMDDGQWLLITLTAGVGGSMLAVGSAAGVALMGLAPGIYTFSAHLRWAWAIALGYGAAIGLHFLLNGALFTNGF